MTNTPTQYSIKAPINHITSDSRKVQRGSLFLAYPGGKVDGRDYIADAIKNGASAVLWEEEGFAWTQRLNVENYPIKDLRLQAGNIANQFYKQPSAKLWMIGVTGTNGKTSITHWLAQTFRYLYRKTAVIGTLGNGILDSLSSTSNTTPDAVELQKMLAGYLKQHVEVVAMEVSSHGLHQGRVNGVHFDIAVLSNLTRDHLDYHGSMEEYAAQKRRLFDMPNLKMAIVNHDDDFGQTIEADFKAASLPIITYGILGGDVQATQLEVDHAGIRFMAVTRNGQAQVSAKLIGRFNVYNILAVLATLLASKVSLQDAADAIATITPVSGRMQQLGGGQLPLVVVDYAHTPDALEKVLSTLKEQLGKTSKLICVFGCGGNRDAGKRALMGKVASAIADVVVVTSDNPRNENAEAIIEEILQGAQGAHIVEQDRAKAISIAILAAKPGDIALIAGKGHEDYQEIAGIKHHFSDIEQAEKALKQYEEAFA
jgi:UDP-N-acetylmuramoyl-L-alanyl-D-glutamate--2,6-diaminopimelate ligase